MEGLSEQSGNVVRARHTRNIVKIDKTILNLTFRLVGNCKNHTTG